MSTIVSKILKKLQNHNVKLFLCPSQKQLKTQATFYTAIFQTKCTLWPIKLNTYMQKIKFTSHKQYLLGHLVFIKAKKTRTDQNTLQVLLLCLNRNESQTFKRSSCKNFFLECDVIDATCFDECFLSHIISGNVLFSKSLLLL